MNRTKLNAERISVLELERKTATKTYAQMEGQY